MNHRFLVLLTMTLAPTCVFNLALAEEATWKVGVAKSTITPDEPYFMAGFGGKKRIASEKRHDLWVKALALEDHAGNRGVLIATDLCGFDRVSYDAICEGVKNHCDLDRSQIILNFTHNHVGPVTRNSLMTFHDFTPNELKQIDIYTKGVEQKVVNCVVEAFKQLKPAKLAVGTGQTNFGINRRNNAMEEISLILCRGGQLKGPTDQTVNVISIRSPDETLIAVLFSYSCHPVTTVEPFWSGDYPGFAMAELEQAHPNATALFFQACGGDQNPVFRGTVETAEDYGHRLAKTVEQVLAKPLKPVAASLETTGAEITLNYERVVERNELEQTISQSLQASSPEERSIAERKARWAGEMLKVLDNEGKLPTGYTYPMCAWKLGDQLLWIALSGETVVDYALMLRVEYGPDTIVTGYCSDLIGYIPSERVWREKRGEEVEYLWEYSRPTYRWAGDVERRILNEVAQLVKRVGYTKLTTAAN